MNDAHLRICASPEWAAFVESELLPWVLQQQDLGDEVLEVGPGPGLTTDVLRRQVPRLTAVEIDERLARSLAGRLARTNVTVLHADATALPFSGGQFSAATLFTMLHHVPSAARQDRMLAELRRVLRRGACWRVPTGSRPWPAGTCTQMTTTCPSTRPPWRTGWPRRGSPAPRSRCRRTASGSPRPCRPDCCAGLTAGPA